MSSPELQNLLPELKCELARLYDKRLKGVILFGSYARGEQDAESDLDILIILDMLGLYSTEIKRTGELISALSLKYGVSISRIFVQEKDWQAGDSPLLRNVRAEGIPA